MWHRRTARSRRAGPGEPPAGPELGVVSGEIYIDLPLGIVDAAMIAIAERLQLTEIATLDHRHFTVVQPRHTATFALLPGSDTP